MQSDAELSQFLAGKPALSLALFHHFINEFKKVGGITIHPAKTMIGIDNGKKRVAWVTQIGKSFLHVVSHSMNRLMIIFAFRRLPRYPGRSNTTTTSECWTLPT